MSSPRYDWWGYAKGMIRRYPASQAEATGNRARERDAVYAAIEQTKQRADGDEQLELIDLVFWRRTHTLAGAAMMIPCSERTARRWHTEFIRRVAKNYGLLD